MTDFYRVYINGGHDGDAMFRDFTDLGKLAAVYLVDRAEEGVTLRVLPLKSDGRRLDGVPPQSEES